MGGGNRRRRPPRSASRRWPAPGASARRRAASPAATPPADRPADTAPDRTRAAGRYDSSAARDRGRGRLVVHAGASTRRAAPTLAAVHRTARACPCQRRPRRAHRRGCWPQPARPACWPPSRGRPAAPAPRSGWPPAQASHVAATVAPTAARRANRAPSCRRAAPAAGSDRRRQRQAVDHARRSAVDPRSVTDARSRRSRPPTAACASDQPQVIAHRQTVRRRHAWRRGRTATVADAPAARPSTAVRRPARTCRARQRQGVVAAIADRVTVDLGDRVSRSRCRASGAGWPRVGDRARPAPRLVLRESGWCGRRRGDCSSRPRLTYA